MTQIADTHNAISLFLEESPYDIGAVKDLAGLAWSGGRDDADARAAAADAVRHGYRGLMRDGNTMDDFLAWRDVIGKAVLFQSHYDVDAYFQYLEWDRPLDKRFYLPRRDQLKPVINGFQRILDDELDILTVSLPPGTGKTTSGIFFLTMLIGLYPDDYNLGISHSSFLSRSIFDGVYSVLTDPEYLWGRIFGREVESSSMRDTAINYGEPSRFPTFTARSIEGTLTGAVRCNRLLYCDDLVSGVEEALNIERLNKLWERYTDDVIQRKIGDCKELHVATRWSVHDPIGRIQKMYGYDSPRVEYISIPALDENGESNFDYGRGLGYTTKKYLEIQDLTSEVSWRCLYQQEPVEREGLLYPEPELRRYYELPDEEPDAILAICDTKDKGKDYAFLPVAYVYGDDYYIDDCVCDNGFSDAVEGKIVATLLKHDVQQARFESNAAGGRIADSVNRQVSIRGGRTHITKKYTTANKETKIIVNAPWVMKNCLFRDKSMIKPGSDYSKMMRFLCSYTQTGKNEFDDVPDGLSMLAEFSRSLFIRKAEICKSPFY